MSDAPNVRNVKSDKADKAPDMTHGASDRIERTRIRKALHYARCSNDRCPRYGRRCLLCLALFNNTPLGFLSEHLFWEKIPYLWALPQFLGIH